MRGSDSGESVVFLPRTWLDGEGVKRVLYLSEFLTGSPDTRKRQKGVKFLPPFLVYKMSVES